MKLHQRHSCERFGRVKTQNSQQERRRAHEPESKLYNKRKQALYYCSEESHVAVTLHVHAFRSM